LAAFFPLLKLKMSLKGRRLGVFFSAGASAAAAGAVSTGFSSTAGAAASVMGATFFKGTRKKSVLNISGYRRGRKRGVRTSEAMAGDYNFFRRVAVSEDKARRKRNVGRRGLYLGGLIGRNRGLNGDRHDWKSEEGQGAREERPEGRMEGGNKGAR
jgi:hypothetical protein